jgi:hypothetical protein
LARDEELKPFTMNFIGKFLGLVQKGLEIPGLYILPSVSDFRVHGNIPHK